MCDYDLNDCNNHPDDFKVYHHAEPKKEDGKSFIAVQVLPEIVDLPWCHVTMLYVLALKPTAIRVSTGTVTADSCVGRVTVYMDNDLISKVEMECSAQTPGMMTGYDLRCDLMALRNSIV